MLNRKRITIFLAVVVGAAFFGYAAIQGFRVLTLYAIAVSLNEMPEGESLFDMSHQSVQTTGNFTDSTAKSNYNFVTGGLGLSFPDGCVLDQYDDSWGFVYCCFEGNDDIALPALPSDRFSTDTNTTETTVSFDNLTIKNRVVPDDAVRYKLISKPDIYDKTIYSHPPSRRIWVRYGYRPPFD
jgi:hypothetical protein